MLLLDEPVAGVPRRRARGDAATRSAALPADVSVLLIEHDMDLVFSFATRMTVLVNGAVLTEGDAAGDRQRPAGARRCTSGTRRRSRAWLSCCSVEGLSAGYGEAVVAAAASSLSLDGGRNAGAAGPQRHRQDHVDQHAGGRDAPARRHASRWPAATLHKLPRTSARRPASAGCRRSATSSSR